MEQNQLDELHRLLEARKSELLSVIIDNEKVLREQLHPEDFGAAAIDSNHPADTLAADPDFEKEIALIRRERAELALVSSALSRFVQGRFGLCVECEIEIPFERLKAIPYTKYCFECRENKEAESKLSSAGRDSEALAHDVSQLGL